MNAPAKNQSAPLKLGVTGGIGSGKSVVCDYLSQMGLTVISADDLARRAVKPGTSAYGNIVECFGPDVLFDNGELDRKKIRGIMTRDLQKKRMLENFIHPEVFRLMTVEFNAAAKRNEPVVVFEVPLLFEAGLKDFFDVTVTVCAQKEVRISRMMNRDHVSRADAEALLAIQMPDDEKIKQSDFIIDNSGTREELRALMDHFYAKLVAGLNTGKTKTAKEVDTEIKM